VREERIVTLPERHGLTLAPTVSLPCEPLQPCLFTALRPCCLFGRGRAPKHAKASLALDRVGDMPRALFVTSQRNRIALSPVLRPRRTPPWTTGREPPIARRVERQLVRRRVKAGDDTAIHGRTPFKDASRLTHDRTFGSNIAHRWNCSNHPMPAGVLRACQSSSCVGMKDPVAVRKSFLGAYHPTVATFCAKSYQIVAGTMTAAVSRPAAAVAARPAFVR